MQSYSAVNGMACNKYDSASVCFDDEAAIHTQAFHGLTSLLCGKAETDPAPLAGNTGFYTYSQHDSAWHADVQSS